MAKYLLEDMVKTKRERRGTTGAGESIKKEVPAKEISRTIEIPSKDVKHAPRYTLWLVASLSVLFLVFAMSFIFSNVKVSVTPKAEDIALNENFLASSEPSGSALFFDLVVISGEEKTTIHATEEKDVSERATGTVLIFNSFSSAPQRLDIDTRLEGSNGKLYKTSAQVTVPGKASDGTPGSVEVGIYAAEAGILYNSGPLDFQILGFKGTPKYDAFKVRTKPGTEIKGGFVGKAPVVKEAEKQAAVEPLKSGLRSRLLQKATGQVPDGFILFPDAIFLNTSESDLSFVYNSDMSMTLVQKGTLYGLLFSKERLTKKIAELAVPAYDGGDVYIPTLEDLHFTLTGGNDISFENAKSISFNLSGPIQVISRIDTGKFASALLGQPKEDFVKILAQFKNIESATLKMNPPWRSTIPMDPRDLDITVDYPKQP